MTANLLQEFQRVSKRVRCPICDHPDWCLIRRDGERAICARVESAHRWGEAGWLHVLGEAIPVPVRRSCRLPINRDFGPLADEYRHNIDIGRTMDLSAQLGVMTTSLTRLRVGWLPGVRAASFPMQDETGKVVGIRLRYQDGRKLSAKGGHEGCFVPDGGLGDLSDVIVICEGPTDTAAALDAGADAIGRPSCTGGTTIIKALLKGREAAIVADVDGPGVAGALRLATELLAARIPSRVVKPLNGKDLRQWHPSHLALQTAIRCANYFTR